jgi:hypothetical protein
VSTSVAHQRYTFGDILKVRTAVLQELLVTNMVRRVCPQLAHDAENVFIRALEALKLLRYDWPMAQRWEDALRAGVTSISPTSSDPPGNIHVEERSSQVRHCRVPASNSITDRPIVGPHI